MNKILNIFLLIMILSGCNNIPYKEATSSWQSHVDVGNWLNDNFSFDKDRQRTIGQLLREEGPSGLLI